MSSSLPPPELAWPDDGALSSPSAAEYQCLQEAAHWYAVLRAEGVTEQDRSAWRAWHEQSPRHAQAWAHIEAVARRFEPLQAAGTGNQAAGVLLKVRRPRISRRQTLSGIAALAFSGWLGNEVWRRRAVGVDRIVAQWADHHTAVGEVRRMALADGTQVWLNTASAIDVDFSATLRKLRLVAGEVLIETAADPTGASRPFVVDNEHGRMRALGTRFSVRQQAQETALAVYEGAVEVRATGGELRVVAAGEQVNFDETRISAPTPADPARQAWRQGVLLAEEMRLQDLLAELGRYRMGHLGVAPEVADLRVMGAYPLKDTDHALAMLADTLPVRVRRILPWWVVIEAKPSSEKE